MKDIWLAEVRRFDQVAFAIGRRDRAYVARWPRLGTMVVDPQERTPVFDVEHGADEALVAKIRTKTIPALVGHIHGRVTLHASAVSDGAVGIAFVGDSGVGKSTLAYVLATDPARRFGLLSDDLLSLSGAAALPSDDSSCLDPIARNSLDVTRALRVATAEVPLRVLVHLRFSDGCPQARRLTGLASAQVLMRSLVRLVLDDPAVHRRDLETIAKISNQVSVFELERAPGLTSSSVMAQFTALADIGVPL